MHVQPTGLGQRFVIPQRARFPMDALSSTPNIAILGAMPTHMGLVPLLPQCSPRLLSLPSLHHALAPVLQPPVLWGRHTACATDFTAPIHSGSASDSCSV